MAGEFLLDTSIIVPFFRGSADIRARLEQAARVYLSSVVLGELYYGAEGAKLPQEQLDKIEYLAGTCTELVCDRGTARHYGRIKQALRQRGRPIPENDIWIAATALQHDLVVVTRDRHFQEMDRLTTASW